MSFKTQFLSTSNSFQEDLFEKKKKSYCDIITEESYNDKIILFGKDL